MKKNVLFFPCRVCLAVAIWKFTDLCIVISYLYLVLTVWGRFRIVLLALNAILTFVLLNSFVMMRIWLSEYANVVYFYFCVACFLLACFFVLI
jgi:hypothetical protein